MASPSADSLASPVARPPSPHPLLCAPRDSYRSPHDLFHPELADSPLPYSGPVSSHAVPCRVLSLPAQIWPRVAVASRGTNEGLEVVGDEIELSESAVGGVTDKPARVLLEGEGVEGEDGGHP
jgi:hypothetical protein